MIQNSSKKISISLFSLFFRQIRALLDYLLNEAKLSAKDITRHPYIFHQNIDEVKLRVIEMNRIGAPITSSVLYLGKTNYLKYIRKYCSSSNDFDVIENRFRNDKKKLII